MELTTKTDECIRMLREAKNYIDIGFCLDVCYYKKNKKIYRNNLSRILDMLNDRLLPDFNSKSDNEAIDNYPLVTGKDLEDEFWCICTIENIPNILNVMKVKFEDVDCLFGDMSEEEMMKIYQYEKLIEYIGEQDASLFIYAICIIRDTYNSKIKSIRKIYNTFSRMAAPPQTNVKNNTTTKVEAQPIRQFTDEQKDILKSYFIASFKGMGKIVNYFEEYLIVDLMKHRTGIGYAAIAKMIYESNNVTNSVSSMPFSKWYSKFCNIMSIEKRTYRISQIKITDKLKSEFHYL
jgi:hypothetical protein